jgi:phage shock protein A
MGIMDRMSRLIRANINDLIDRAEDPEKMLNELLREMNDNIREARVQVANMIAQEKLFEGDMQDAQRDAHDWERKAELAVGRGRDDLAREALRRKRDAESIATVYAQQLTSQQEMVAKLKQQLRLLEAKYDEALSKKDVLVARHRATVARKQISETLTQLPGFDTTSELDRMERKIRGEEARAAAMEELQGESTSFQFAELEQDLDVEDDLAALKARVSGEDPMSLPSGDAQNADSTATAVPSED